jgi:hypothetical protein
MSTWLPMRYDSEDDCPDRDKHTPKPHGYLEHSVWAARMSESHTNEQCQTCGFWAIWRDVDGQVVLGHSSDVLPPLATKEPEQPPCDACKGVGWYEAQDSPTGRCEVCGRDLLKGTA